VPPAAGIDLAVLSAFQFLAFGNEEIRETAL
jgi:hypothetical protein